MSYETQGRRGGEENNLTENKKILFAPIFKLALYYLLYFGNKWNKSNE
jgi:hypothetical protein